MNLPIFHFPTYRNFLIPQIPKTCDLILVSLIKMQHRPRREMRFYLSAHPDYPITRT